MAMARGATARDGGEVNVGLRGENVVMSGG